MHAVLIDQIVLMRIWHREKVKTVCGFGRFLLRCFDAIGYPGSEPDGIHEEKDE